MVLCGYTKKEFDSIKNELFNSSTENLSPNTNASKSVLMLDDNNNIIKEFESIAEASRYTNINTKSIRDAANKKQIHAGGYKWTFKE